MTSLRMCVAILCGLSFVPCCFGADSFVVYQIGAKEPAVWAVFKDFFKEQGLEVAMYQAEATLEKHLEKIPRINKSGAKFFVAMEMGYGEEQKVLVAMTGQMRPEEGPGGGGSGSSDSAKVLTLPDWGSGDRFVAIDDLPVRHATESKRLAEAIAGPFKQRVKRVPLFPLLGVDMPGIFLHLECSREKMREALGLLHGGIRSYLRRDVSHER